SRRRRRRSSPSRSSARSSASTRRSCTASTCRRNAAFPTPRRADRGRPMRPPDRPPPADEIPDAGGDGARRAAVLAALDAVMDPELDAPVTAMGFVESIAIADGSVHVDFRLPTFWCSANFAFLMAGDMKLAIEALDWVASATIELVDHFAAGRINRAVA